MSIKANLIKKTLVVAFLFCAIFGGVAIKPQPAKAMVVEDFLTLAVDIKDYVWQLAQKAIEHSANVFYKNTLKYYLNNLAYNAATSLVEGGTGKTPLFPKLQPKQLLEQAAGDALGEFIDTVIKDAGLEDFNICNPSSVKTTLNILLPSFKEVDPNSYQNDERYKAKCHWQDIKKNWTEFAEAARKDPSKYLGGIKTQFKDGANELDISASVTSGMMNRQKEAKVAAQINVLANQYVNPVVAPISKFIRTPASVVGGTFLNSVDKSSESETQSTGDIVADAMGIFTNTLAAKLQKKIMGGLDNNSMPSSKVTLKQFNTLSNDGFKVQGDQFADFKKVNAVRTGDAGMDVFEKFSSTRLPMQGDSSLTKGPGPTSEVLPDYFITAARQELTLKQAIDQGIIPADITFGFKTQKRLSVKVSDEFVDEDIKNDDSSWSNSLSYRGMLIGRTQRIFPQSWELAALYWRYYDNESSSALTLQSVMNCFADSRSDLSPYGTRYNEDPRYPENCRRDMNGNGNKNDVNPMEDYNPYFHLVDPNWVLKTPSTKCAAKGSGNELIYQSVQCSEDNVDAGANQQGSGTTDTSISRGEGTPICEADQAKKLGIKNTETFKYDIPVKTITRDDNYCADWQSCVKEDDKGNCLAYGYCVEEKPVTKLQANSCAFPVGSRNGLYASCDSFQIAGQQYDLLKNTLKKCKDTDAGCKQYATVMKPAGDGSLAWDLSVPNSSIYLNSNAGSCDQTNNGCTKVTAYKVGTNLIYNGSFANAKTGSAAPLGWVVEKDAAPTDCQFVQKFHGESGAALTYTDPGVCAVVNEVPALVSVGYEYDLSFKLKAENGNEVTVIVSGVDQNNAATKTETMSAVSPADWIKISKKITLSEDSSSPWVFPLSTKGLKIKFQHNDVAGRVGIAEVSLNIVAGPLVDASEVASQTSEYREDYTKVNTSSYKLAPKYLGCELYYQQLGNYSKADCPVKGGVWNEKLKLCAVGGSSACDSFAPMCSAQDVGCQLFTSADGSVNVPAKVSGDDICPNECINYDSYSRQPSYFEANEFPAMYANSITCQQAGGSWNGSACLSQPRYVNLIPATAAQCTAAAVGCQSFTNLSASSNGGEKQEYFSYLRPCVTETSVNVSKVFYTWEGSDTSGYQLKKWSRLISNKGVGLCTNVDADTGACLDSGSDNVWTTAGASSTDIGNRALCSKDDLDSKPDCRDFFDINDRHFYVYQSKTVVAKESKSPDACVSYRNDATGKIYNADPADAVRCTQAEVGCRAFKGGTSNNVRTAFENKFEDGTIGAWKNTAQGSAGLTVYNDSLRQGGSSLLVAVSDDEISYKTEANFVEGNKEYTLVVLAKKVGVTGTKSAVNPVGSSTTLEPIKFVYDGNLQTEWREYRLGSIVANNETNLKNEIKVKFNNLGANEAFAIDEIRLIEGRDVYYLIDKTWDTPVSCDNPINNLNGCDANGNNCGQRTAEGAQLGCQAYSDKKNNTVAIKAFTQLCSPAAVDCQAFIDTANSTEPTAINKFGSCSADNGVVKDNACLIKGIEVCKLNGATSCQYLIAAVPEDKLTYFVPKEEMICSSQFIGCMALGKPSYDLTKEPATVSKFETTYLINNPDKYNNILCGADGLLCEMMVASDGSQGVYVSPIGVDEKASRLCVFNSGKNRWVQKADQEKDCELDNPIGVGDRTKYLTASDNVNYRGWVGMCEDSFVGCKEYRNPEQSVTAGANWCDASVSPSDYGVCDTANSALGETASSTPDGSYCQKKISGIDHLVCKLNSSATKCIYTASEWTCFAKEKMNNGRDENAVCQINGNDVCVIKANGNGTQDMSSCSYSPLCSSTYAIGSSVKQCSGGQVDRSSGCAPFYDVSASSLTGAARATKDKGVLISCDPSAKPGEEKYCNTNVILENHLSRQCSEWLYCTSGAKVGDQNVCFDVGRCAEADQNGQCVRPSTKTNIYVANQTYDFTNILERENVRYSTGYGRTGLSWSNNKAIEGFASPESMKQSVNDAKLSNGDFEDVNPTSSTIKDWYLYGSTNNSVGTCETLTNGSSSDMFDGKNAWDGYYSLKLTTSDPAGYCAIISNSGKGQDNGGNKFLPFNVNKRYMLSYAAKSSNGNQVTASGVSFFDADYDICGVETSYYSGLPAGKKVKYVPLTSGSTTLYYNKYCVDKNGSINLTQMPGWAWGNKLKLNKIKKDWQEYSMAIDPISLGGNDAIPPNASYIRVDIYGPHPGWGDVKGAPGTIWLDDVSLVSSLQVSENKYIASMCRLYPSADAKQCSYSKLNKEFKGWQGYCLEEDPYVPGQCLQWFPVDTAGGDSLTAADEKVSAYDNRSSLYMCVASRGVYDASESHDYTNRSDDGGIQMCNSGLATGSFYDLNGLRKFNDIYHVVINVDKRACDDSAADWVGFIGNHVLKPGYWVRNGKKLPAFWWGGGQVGNTNYKDSSVDGFPYTNWTDFWDDRQNNVCSWTGNSNNDCNRGGAALLFKEDGTFEGSIVFANDGSDDTGGLAFYNIYIRLKDSCEMIAKVVDDNGENKIVQNKYNNNWNDPVNNPMGYGKSIPGTPYGSLVLHEALNGVTPNNWGSQFIPYNFNSNRVGTPLSALNSGGGPAYCQDDNLSVETQCQGSKTNQTSHPNCDVCGGVGKYEYVNGKMTANRCDVDGSTNANCKAPESLYKDGSYSGGVNRLKGLFAKVYGWYKLAVGTTGELIYQSIGYGNDGTYDDLSESGLPATISSIKIDNNSSGNVNIAAPGKQVTVNFKIDVPDEQLPLTRLVIDWGDGSRLTDFSGEFNERNSDGNPFTFSHWYGCVPTADGSRCRACTNGALVKTDGSCEYSAPKIYAQDNWEWCAVSGGATTTMKGIKYGSNCTTVLPGSDDYVPYGGVNAKIIVRPK